MLEITDETYKTEVLGSELPVVIDFWAAWCGPCRGMAPIFEDLAKQFEGQAKFVKINVDETDIASEFEIRSIPTFVIVEKGQTIDVLIGSQPKQRLAEWIERNI